jgi:hypothetical protein
MNVRHRSMHSLVCTSCAMAAVLLGGAVSTASDTLTISSLFSMDYLYGTVGPDLAEVFANGHEHTWTLTLYGTSQSHDTFTNPYGYAVYATEIHATSFDLEFFGPDAATLNGIVSDHIAGGDVFIYLENDYSSGIGDDFAVMFVEPTGPDFQFLSDCDTFGCGTLFPTDADGYPVVGPDPFSIWNEYSALGDNRPGNYGYIQSRASLVTFEWSVGPLPGDFNGDDIVDAADYVLWRKNPGGIYTTNDYNAWRANFGRTSGSGAAINESFVPEPSVLGLLALAVPTLLRRRHRSHSACVRNSLVEA